MKDQSPSTKVNRMCLIELHPLAPPKPDFGAGCNGCGACCAMTPCPVAHVFLLQFTGACRALIWQEETRRYVCGMVARPDRYLRPIPTRWREAFGRFFASRIAAGSGCDFAAEIDEPPPSREPDPMP